MMRIHSVPTLCLLLFAVSQSWAADRTIPTQFATIEAALAASSVVTGDVLILETGKGPFAGNVAITKGVTIKSQSAASPETISIPSGAMDIQVAGVTIQDVTVSPDAANTKVKLSASGSATLTNVTWATTYQGLQVDITASNNSLTMNNCTMSLPGGNSPNIKIAPAASSVTLKVSNSTINNNNGGVPFVFNGASANVNLDTVTVAGQVQYGMQMNGNNQVVTINNSSFDAWNDGIDINGYDCQLTLDKTSIVALYGRGVSGNYVAGGVNPTIHIQNGCNIVAAERAVFNHGGNGAYVLSDSTLIGKSTAGFDHANFFVADTGWTANITNCIVQSESGNGIVLGGELGTVNIANTTVSNPVGKTMQYGIITNSSALTCTLNVSGTTVLDVKQNGISVDQANFLHVTNSTIYGCKQGIVDTSTAVGTLDHSIIAQWDSTGYGVYASNLTDDFNVYVNSNGLTQARGGGIVKGSHTQDVTVPYGLNNEASVFSSIDAGSAQFLFINPNAAAYHIDGTKNAGSKPVGTYVPVELSNFSAE